MRTTVNLSDKAHGLAASLARDEGISLSEAVNRLILQRSLANASPPKRKSKSRLPVFECVRQVSSEDVRQLEDAG